MVSLQEITNERSQENSSIEKSIFKLRNAGENARKSSEITKSKEYNFEGNSEPFTYDDSAIEALND